MSFNQLFRDLLFRIPLQNSLQTKLGFGEREVAPIPINQMRILHPLTVADQ